jgi:hypothetical protein
VANVDWTADEDKFLTQYWAEGLSAAQISRRFAASRSRNAIIGRANRLHLLPRKSSNDVARAEWQRAKERKRNFRQAPPLAKAPSLPKDPSLAADLAPSFYDPPYETCLTFADMPWDGCRFPIKDRFCPHKKTHGSYCAHHHSIAHGKQRAGVHHKPSGLLVRCGNA